MQRQLNTFTFRLVEIFKRAPNTRLLESLSVGGMFDTVRFLKTHQESVQKCCTTDRLQTPALLGDTPAEWPQPRGESSSSRMPAQGVKRPSMFFQRKHQHMIRVISADTLKLPVRLARSHSLIMNISPHCCYLLIRMELQWQLSDIRIKETNVSTQNCLGGKRVEVLCTIQKQALHKAWIRWNALGDNSWVSISWSFTSKWKKNKGG